MPLALRTLYQADPATVAGKDFHWHHVEHVPVNQVEDGEIEITLRVSLAQHPAPVRLGPTGIHGVQMLRAVVPGTLDLYAKELTATIKG
jgi:hypothetical protein